MNKKERKELKPVYDPKDVPEGLSDEEELRFWETHSITEEFLRKTEEVPEDERPRPRNRTRPINVRFDDFTLGRLKALADRRNVGYQTLLKEFVTERLYEEEKREGILPAEQTKETPAPPEVDAEGETLNSEHLRRVVQQVQPNTQVARAVRQAVKNMSQTQIDSRTIRVIEQTMRNIQRPAMQEYIKNALRIQSVAGREATAISQFRLPPATLRPSVDINENAMRAAVGAANSAYSEQLRKVTQQFARSVPIRLSPEALAAAQFTSLQQSLKSYLPEVTRTISQGTLANVQRQYAKTLRRTTELLSSANVKRMIELAESEGLIEEAMETAQETGLSLGEVTAEDIEPFSLDLDNATDALLPYISWAIMVLSVALIVSYSNPSFTQYKEPLTQTLLWLATLERALKEARENKKIEDFNTSGSGN